MKSIEINSKDIDKKFGAFIAINTSECELWAIGGENPMVQSITSKEELERCGWGDEDYANMKIGSVIQSEDYEGCYLMRIG